MPRHQSPGTDDRITIARLDGVDVAVAEVTSWELPLAARWARVVEVVE